LVDRPGGRKAHARPTPLVGGVAMFTAFVVSTLTLGIHWPGYRHLIAGSLLLVVVGALDDARGLSPRLRFAAQIVASLLMAVGAGVVLDDFGQLLLPTQVFSLWVFAVPITLFSTVGVINAVNMTDGLDGLAASLILISIFGLGIIAWSRGEIQLIGGLILLAGAILAFLLSNLRPNVPGLVFMGDAGSLFLGFVLAWFLIEVSQGEHRLLPPVTALWLFALPLVDTISMMLRRILMGRSPFLADREHFHHVLLAAGFSPKQTLVLMVLLALAGVGVGLTGYFLGIEQRLMFLGFLSLFALHFWTIMRAWRFKSFLAMPLFRSANART
jgi:UDP-GlcNAc:undecaprenyl-phosphate/decaprenyl-phosphate GlcNAc-1-phosphate transferase